jgi:predicted esterase
VPFARVRETGEALERMGAHVELCRYPGMPHIIHDEELDAARRLLLRMVASGVDSCKSRASKPTSAA